MRDDFYREATPAYYENQMPPHAQPAPMYTHRAQPQGNRQQHPLTGVTDNSLVAAKPHDCGAFSGGEYQISFRHSSAIMKVSLSQLCPFKAAPGAMVSMSPSLDLKGTFKFSFRKLAAGADISMSTFTGPGEVILAPIMSGDIEVLQINEGDVWTMNTRAFLGCTQQIERKPMTQSLWKGLFSGAGFVVEKVQGQGLLFVQGYGAIMKVTIPQGEEYIVDNGHLVASNCEYSVERVGNGGMFSRMLAGEGFICKFKGPGQVYLQTRNLTDFLKFIRDQVQVE